MDEEITALTIYIGQTIAPAVAEAVDIAMLPSLDQLISAWIADRYKNGQSEKTRKAYQDTLADFRHELRRRGLDLGADPRQVATIAEVWADSSRRPGHQVTWSTYNQRLAIVSSYYTYGIKKEILQTNPISRLDRRKQGRKDKARPLSAQQVQSGLAKIDRATTEGLRDYALLFIAVTTGHRASELVGLRMKHLSFAGQTCLVQWERCKGNGEMQSLLMAKATQALLVYLRQIYGPDLCSADDAPVWVSFSKRNRGQAIGTRTISDICDSYLGTTKVHTTRHTAAIGMLKSGASLAEIGKFLGHKNLKTTADYLDELTGYENPYGDALETAFGI